MTCSKGNSNSSLAVIPSLVVLACVELHAAKLLPGWFSSRLLELALSQSHQFACCCHNQSTAYLQKSPGGMPRLVTIDQPPKISRMSASSFLCFVVKMNGKRACRLA